MPDTCVPSGKCSHTAQSYLHKLNIYDSVKAVVRLEDMAKPNTRLAQAAKWKQLSDAHWRTK